MTLALLTSLDNLRVGFALGLLPLTLRERVGLTLGFAAAELTMSLLGARFAVPGLAPFALAVAVLLALAGTFSRLPGLPAVRVPSWVLALLPLAFSLDNLAAGAGDAGSALFAGLLGGLLSGVGLAAGGSLGRRAPRAGAVLGALGLVTVALTA